jgi:hypothetical protein
MVPVALLFAVRAATEKNERPLSEQLLMYAQERDISSYVMLLPTVLGLCAVQCAFVCYTMLVLSGRPKKEEGGKRKAN